MILIFLLLFYSSLELTNVFKFRDSLIFLVEVDSYFNETYAFELDKLPGLQVAFGLTAFDSNYEMLNETEYAQIKAEIRSWSQE